MPELGKVIWITGLSGVGKSTLANHIYSTVKPRLKNIVLIDGDAFREILGNDLGHNLEDRIKNAYRICRFSKYLSHQGIHVICATMSLFKEIHDWNREHLRNYFEVYIDVNLDTLKSRDPKGIYSTAPRDRMANIVGIDVKFDAPTRPDLTIENNNDDWDVNNLAQAIIVGSGLPMHFERERP